jgi:hypothetical protein
MLALLFFCIFLNTKICVMSTAVAEKKAKTNIVIAGQFLPIESSSDSLEKLSKEIGLNFVLAIGDRIRNASDSTVVGTVLSPVPKENTRLLCYKRDCDGRIYAASHAATRNIKFLEE